MKNKELIEQLSTFPEEMEVMLDRNGAIYTECAKPYIKLLNSEGKQRDCIVLCSPIKIN